MVWKIKKNGKFDTGRPNAIDEVILGKLEQAFSEGNSYKTACEYAGIHPSTLYVYQSENPQFKEWKESLKERPVLKAKHTIIKHLDDPKVAQWYLEHKAKDEFGTRTEITGVDGKPIAIEQTVDIEKIKEFKEMLGV